MSGKDSFGMRVVLPMMLNGENWVVWKFQVEQLMRANDILDILHGSFKKPIKITESDENGRTIVKNQKDIDQWNRLDGWAMSILSTSMEPALIDVTATSSYDLWTKLKAIHEPKFSKQELWNQFYGITKNSNETVNQLVSRVVSAAEKLRNASATCDDEQVIAFVFHVLPDDFWAVELQWEALESSRRTIATLRAKLNAHEEMLNRRAQRVSRQRRLAITPTTGRRRK